MNDRRAETPAFTFGCFGSAEQLSDEIGKLGLSVPAQQRLIKHLGTSSHSNYAQVCEEAIDDGFSIRYQLR